MMALKTKKQLKTHLQSMAFMTTKIINQNNKLNIYQMALR